MPRDSSLRRASASAPGQSSLREYQSITDVVYYRIRDMILGGELADDEPLPQEALAERLGVSRIPVREAYQRLERDGLLTFRPRRGAVVAGLSVDEVREVFSLRVLLETDVLRRAVPAMTADVVDRARDALEASSDAVVRRDFSAWVQRNREFHLALYAPAGRPRALAIIHDLHTHAYRYLRMHVELNEDQDRMDEEHRAMLHWSAHHDTERAVSILRDHIEATSNAVLAFLEARRGA
jgi:DNA-binding GntR family transcriptional regulator